MLNRIMKNTTSPVVFAVAFVPWACNTIGNFGVELARRAIAVS